MTKKFSSFKNQQVLVENWRKFSHTSDEELLKEEIIILTGKFERGEISQEELQEGVRDWAKRAKRAGKNALAGAVMAGALAGATPAMAAPVTQDAPQTQVVQQQNKKLENEVKKRFKVKELKQVSVSETLDPFDGDEKVYIYETDTGLLVALYPISKDMYDAAGAGNAQSDAHSYAERALLKYTQGSDSTTSTTTTKGDTTTTTSEFEFSGNLSTSDRGQIWLNGYPVVKWTGPGYAVQVMSASK